MLDLINISSNGIALGVGFHLLASLVSSLIVYTVHLKSSTLQLVHGMADPMYYENDKVQHMSLVGGVLFTIVMGMVAELYSTQETIINALFAGLVIVLIHLIIMFIKPGAFNKMSSLIIIIGTVPLSCFGGWLLTGN
jgi:hypothetical protein